MESDPDLPSPPGSAARRLSSEKEAKKSPVTIRNCSACSVVASRICRPFVECWTFALRMSSTEAARVLARFASKSVPTE